VQRLAGFHDKWHIIPALIIDKEHCDSKGLGDAALGHSRVADDPISVAIAATSPTMQGHLSLLADSIELWSSCIVNCMEEGTADLPRHTVLKTSESMSCTFCV